MRVLVVEDGFEYVEAFRRFVPGVEWVRAGTGGAALRMAGDQPFDALFMDMCFDRAPANALLGDLAAVAGAVGGGQSRALRHLQDHQGLYILRALRDDGVTLPALISYDFSSEPRRWRRVRSEHHPVDYVSDAEGPVAMAYKLQTLRGGDGR